MSSGAAAPPRWNSAHAATEASHAKRSFSSRPGFGPPSYSFATSVDVYVLETPTEAALRSDTILSATLVLFGETFTHSVGLDGNASAGIIAGFISSQSELSQVEPS